MPNNVDVFWSFRSPYSYLVTPDLLRLREDYGVTVSLRPVLPIALRAKAAVFDAKDKKRPQYIVMDSFRRAKFLGLPMAWPKPDPVIQNMETFEVPEEQPHIWRLSTLGVEAERRGRGIDFAFHVAALLWGRTEDWHEGDHLALAAAEAGLDLTEMDSALEQYDAKAEISKNHELLEQAGHWGVPTMVFNGEPFFGQDRIDTLRWRLDEAGLRHNSAE